MKNIYYFRKISKIGGIETFFRELAKKYKDLDITFYYQEADPVQLKEIDKYCRCVQFRPKDIKEPIKCDKAFFNFNLDMLDYVDAKTKVLVVHGNYHMLDGKPPMDPRIDEVWAVSKDSAKAYTELTGIPCKVCYNPLTFEEYDTPLRLICACRLSDKVKGGKRMQELVEHLDQYCATNNRHYLMTIFTNGGKCDSPNVAIMPSRLDIRPFMKDSDYLIQLSDNFEGYNYSVNEMLYLFKKPVVITPCNVYEELGIDDTMSIRINFDMSNVDEAIDKMFNTRFNVDYKPPMDKWDTLLVKGAKEYKGAVYMKVRATNLFAKNGVRPAELPSIPSPDVEFECTEDRAEYLANLGYVEIIKEVVEKPKKTSRTKKKEA